MIKLKHCEKATKFEKKSTCFEIYSVASKQVGDFFQIFVAFSENLNFNILITVKSQAVDCLLD